MRMSKPLAAKGVGACLKHVLYTRLTPAPPRQSRGDGTDGCRRQCERGSPGAMPVLGATRLPLDEDDPLPPSHDRGMPMQDMLGKLYRAERPGLLRFLSRRTREDCAEDMIQQLFVRMAARTEDHAAAIASPGAYLREAARKDRKSTRLNSSHIQKSRMPSSA